MIARYLLALLLALAAPAAVAQEGPQAPASVSEAQPAIFDVEIVARYPHDPQAFTQGLLWHEGHLYESTGIEGQSQVRKVDLTTGAVLAARDLPGEQFGEGMALWGDELISLTWQDQVVHRWTLDGLEPVRSDPFPYEGWGLAVLGDELVASDGSATLRFLDPETYAVKREITVTLNGREIRNLNELEVVDGMIWANQWFSTVIVGIDPATGAIRRIVDMSPLVDEIGTGGTQSVLNGIAYDAQGERWFATGKLWPTLYEIRMVPREEAPDGGPPAG